MRLHVLSFALVLFPGPLVHLSNAFNWQDVLENKQDRFERPNRVGDDGHLGRRPRPIRGDGNSHTILSDDEEAPKELIQQQLARAKQDIQKLMANDPRMAPKFIRLGFHDCVGGCDGCVDLDESDNNGLDIPIDALDPIVRTHVNTTLGVSRADLWVLAALTAAEMTQRLQEFPMTHYGRVDCEDTFKALRQRCKNKLGVTVPCDAKHGPHRHLPMADLDTHSILKFFRMEFQFTPDEVVALMGAHSIGFAKPEHSGFQGHDGWTPQNLALNNDFYVSLVMATWKQIPIDNSHLEGIPDRFQWIRTDDSARRRVEQPTSQTGPSGSLRGLQTASATHNNSTVPQQQKQQFPRAIGNGRGDDIFMINADMALVRDFRNDIDAHTGQVSCQYQPQVKKACPFASTFHVAKLYVQNEEKWMADFHSVYYKMLNHGYRPISAGRCESPPCRLVAV